MAVFTPLTIDELSPWMERFPLGRLTGLVGIASGIENSNFFVQTTHGEYVLTLFEKLSSEQLPFYLNLMRHLARKNIKVPLPLADHAGEILHRLKDKPAAVVTKLAGRWLHDPEPQHCAQVGDMLARMHLAAQDLPLYHQNLRGLTWWQETVPLVLPFLAPPSARCLADELQAQIEFARTPRYRVLPRGAIHADLFRDNVLFDGDVLSGFFDFYFAGVDAWLFDVAVTLNDWCIVRETGEIKVPHAHALLTAYHAARPFTSDERAAWRLMMRAAALRFWISRLYDFHLPRTAEMLTPHDPTHFERILNERIARARPSLP